MEAGIRASGAQDDHHRAKRSRAHDMLSVQVLLVAMLAGFTMAAPRPDSPPQYGPPPTYKQPGMPYDFAYSVKDDYTGNDFAHDENSDGSLTSGSYRVLLPDGRTQRVTFTADHHKGYVAEVAYDGQAVHPAPAYNHPPTYI